MTLLLLLLRISIRRSPSMIFDLVLLLLIGFNLGALWGWYVHPLHPPEDVA